MGVGHCAVPLLCRCWVEMCFNCECCVWSLLQNARYVPDVPRECAFPSTEHPAPSLALRHPWLRLSHHSRATC